MIDKSGADERCFNLVSTLHFDVKTHSARTPGPPDGFTAAVL